MYPTAGKASCVPKLLAFFFGQDASDIDLVLVRVRILCFQFVKKTAGSRLAQLLLLAVGPSNPLMPSAVRLFAHRFCERL